MTVNRNLFWVIFIIILHRPPVVWPIVCQSGSLKSALSYHRLIPEAVYACTSVTLKESKDFEPPLGLFSYKWVPQNIFYAGVERFTNENGNVFLIAEPIKALADYVYIHRRDWAGLETGRQEPACRATGISRVSIC